jgi:hypothetical protein
LPDWLGISRRGIPHAGIPYVITSTRRNLHVGLHVKRPSLLSEFNLNWNVSTNFSKTSSDFKKVHSAVIRLVLAKKLTDGHGEANRRNFAAFSGERA